MRKEVGIPLKKNVADFIKLNMAFDVLNLRHRTV
jgi:hypothetical protein